MKTWVGTDGKTLVNDTGKTYACEYCPCTYHCDKREVTATYSVPEDYATLDEAIAAHGNEYYTKIIFKGTYTSLLPVFKCVIDGDGVATFSGGAYALNHYNNFDTFYGEIINANITGAGIWYSRLIYCKIYDITGDNSADSRLRYSWFNMAYLKSCCGCEITNIRSHESRNINGTDCGPGEIYISAQGCTIDGVHSAGTGQTNTKYHGGNVQIGGSDSVIKNVTSADGVPSTIDYQGSKNGGSISISQIFWSTPKIELVVENVQAGKGGEGVGGEYSYTAVANGGNGGTVNLTLKFWTGVSGTVKAKTIRSGVGGNGGKLYNDDGTEHSTGAGGNGGNLGLDTSGRGVTVEDVILGNGGNGSSATTLQGGVGGAGGSIPESSIEDYTLKDITLGNGGDGGSGTTGEYGGAGGRIGWYWSGDTYITNCAFINITFGNSGNNGTSLDPNSTYYAKSSPSGGFGQGSYGYSYQDSENCHTTRLCGCYFENITFGSLGTHSSNVGSAGAGGYAGNGGSSITGKGGNGGDLYSTQKLPAGIGGSGNPPGTSGGWYLC